MLHSLGVPYPHPDSKEPSTAQISFDLRGSQLKGSARILNLHSSHAKEDTEARGSEAVSQN